MRQPPFLVLVAASLLLTLACGDENFRANAGASCTAGGACAEGHACFENVCRPQQGVACDDARARCVTGLICEGGLCVGDAGNECDEGNLCASALACLDGRCAAGAAGRCGGAGEIICQAGLVCEEATCHVAVAGTCGTVERICASGLLCEDGTCRAGAGRWCGSSEECLTGYLCHAGACLGVPGTACTTEAPCAPGGVCRDGDCAARAGGACSEAIACDAGLVCAGGVCLGAVGHACVETSECGPELTCEALTCVVAIGGGCDGTERPCADGLVCADGICRGAAGHACEGSDDCAPALVCEDQACRVLPGDECAVDGDCLSGSVCVAQRCVLPPGAACATDPECRDGYACVEGSCRPRTGSPCSPAITCLGGDFCDNGSCAVNQCLLGRDPPLPPTTVHQAALVCPGTAPSVSWAGEDCDALDLLLAGAAGTVASFPGVRGQSLRQGPVLSAEGSYEWRFVAGRNGCPAVTGSKSFLVGKPAAPTLTGPETGCELARSTVTVAGARASRVDLTLTGPGGYAAQFDDVAEGAAITSDPLGGAGTYTWTATARLDGCADAISSLAVEVAPLGAADCPFTIPTATLAADTSADFGTVGLGTSASRTFVYTNTSSSFPLHRSEIRFASPTLVATADSTCLSTPVTMAPGASCTIIAVFTPTTAAPVSAALTVASDAYRAPHALTLTARGEVPMATLVAQAGADFGAVVLGQSARKAFLFTNTSTVAPVGLGAIAVTPAASFARAATTTCVQGATLAPGATCLVVVDFLPVTPGPAEGSLSVASNAQGAPHLLSLSGIGTSALASLSVSPAPPIDFGAVGLGTTANVVLTLRNNGSATAALGVGAPVAPFGKSASSCITALGAGASCTVTVSFAPTDLVTDTGSFLITFGAGGEQLQVDLRGSGAVPAPTFTLATWNLFHQFTTVTPAPTTPYVPYSVAGLVNLTNTADGYVFSLGSYVNLQGAPYQAGIVVANGALSYMNTFGRASNGSALPFVSSNPIAPITLNQTFHLAVEAFSATGIRVAVNGHFVKTITVPATITQTTTPSLGSVVGINTPNAFMFGLAGTVTDYKYWNGKALWSGADFDYTRF